MRKGIYLLMKYDIIIIINNEEDEKQKGGECESGKSE